MSFACVAQHEVPQSASEHGVRLHLEQGRCPVCPDRDLDGLVSGGLEWAHCPCCGSKWRLEPEGFALRPGHIVEEWR